MNFFRGVHSCLFRLINVTMIGYSTSPTVGPLLYPHFFAGPNQLSAALSQAGQRGFQLFLGLNGALEKVAGS